MDFFKEIVAVVVALQIDAWLTRVLAKRKTNA